TMCGGVFLQKKKAPSLSEKMPLYKYATTHSLYCIVDFEGHPFLLPFDKFDYERLKGFKCGRFF
ncbi:MAG: hypothetical protein AB8B69_24705, partial [Chitinophagales bacterium]